MGSDKGQFTRRGFVRSAALGSLAARMATAPAAAAAEASAAQATSLDRDELLHLARALLPAELTDVERGATVDSLLAWLRGYRANAEMGHGYGFTRLRNTPVSPERRYIEQMAAFRDLARERHDAALSDLDDAALRELAAEVIEAAAPDQRNVPGRPDAAHVTIALISAYTRSAVAADRAYGAQIRREGCRGLFTDVDELRPFAMGIVEGDPARSPEGDR